MEALGALLAEEEELLLGGLLLCEAAVAQVSLPVVVVGLVVGKHLAAVLTHPGPSTPYKLQLIPDASLIVRAETDDVKVFLAGRALQVAFIMVSLKALSSDFVTNLNFNL